jgi:hypothetical protein
MNAARATPPLAGGFQRPRQEDTGQKKTALRAVWKGGRSFYHGGKSGGGDPLEGGFAARKAVTSPPRR